MTTRTRVNPCYFPKEGLTNTQIKIRNKMSEEGVERETMWGDFYFILCLFGCNIISSMIEKSPKIVHLGVLISISIQG